MSLPSLPTELLQHIANGIETLETLRALSCVSQRFYAIFNPALYHQDARNSSIAPGSFAVTWAAENGNLALLKKALSYGAELAPSSPPQKKRTVGSSLWEKRCMMTGRLHLIKTDRPDHPLCIAVRKGHGDITEFLIVDQGCDMDMLDQLAYPLLSVATHYRHAHLIKFLIERGASQMAVDQYYGGTGRSPIHMAVVGRFEKGMELLLDPKLHLDSRPSYEQMNGALLYALLSDMDLVYGDDQKNTIRLLLDSGLLDGEGRLDFSFRQTIDSALRTPLQWAVEQDDIRYLERFVKAGADPNFPAATDPWETVLVQAVKLQNQDKVRLLLPKTRRVVRTLALAWSIKLWSPDDEKGRNIPRILLQNGTLPDYEPDDDTFLRSGSRNASGQCTLGIEYPEELTDAPLVLAVHSGHLEMVQLLIEHGANVNVRFYELLGNCAVVSECLSLADKLGHLDIAEVLRDRGAVERDYEAERMAQFEGWSYNRPTESTQPNPARDESFAPIPE
ncbi:Hypothetical protein PENO1_063400 [Penicillium occitanis (nom. inval.)]|nr:hypothetical protein PENOC_082480 [Penicillium occitanis (nom. inval.)]PCG97415.1 Hypothetical protein PENO1_063400 [Penicillium occitanis (nom. inval.)]